MGRPTIPAHVLADRGVPITLYNDQTVTICFNFRSLMLLEERFGSLGAALKIIEDGMDGAAFTSLVNILATGLGHEHQPTADGGSRYDDPQVLADYLDPKAIEAYSTAMGEAFTKAFPQGVAGGDASDPQTPETAASPGASGTTLPESTSVSPTPTSGP